MSAESQRKAYRHNCNMVRPQIYSEKSLVESVVDFFSDVVPQAYSSQKVEDKEKIQWVRFENCDCCDISRNPDLYKYDTKGLPLLLILGYSNGVQIWHITPNGEALEILSVRQGPVKICRILPNPEPVLGYTDSFTSKRPLVVMCDSSSAGQPFCGMKFVSLKTGDEVHSVSFKTLPIHNIECSKRFLVVTFLEKICVYEACRFKQLFWITSCFPASAPNVNPIALSSRWLAYADKRLVAMHQSCGGMSGDGTQSYAATVISAAKGAFKGLSMFGEAMVNSVTGCKPTGSKKQQDYVQLDNGNRPGIVTVVDIQNVHNDHFNVNEDNEGSGLIAHFHAHANEPVANMAFDPTGTLLVTACKLGHNFHIFRLMAHPCSSSLGAVHHLYTLHRGDTTAKVMDIGFNHDSRWVTVSTHRGTTHIFAITPYGGIPNVRTHCQPFVVNRASRFHRSAGLEDIEHSPLGRRSPVLSTSPSSSGHYDRYPTLIQQNTLNNNMGNPRLPPYPHPITVYPLYQIKQPLNVVLNPGNKNMSPNHSPTSLDNIFAVASRFCTPRLCVVGSPKLDVERREAGKRPVDCLFIMAQSGSLVEYVLDPKARTVSEKVSDESLLELNVIGRMQWNLQRLKTSTELRPPLPTNSPLLLSHEAVISQVPTAPEFHDLPGLTRHDSKDSLSSDHSGKDEDEWVSQVEIITHAGPHRRLWMGPQFSFKTYHENTTVLSSNSSALLSQSPDTNMVAMDITGEEGDLESLRVQPTRSNPVSMPNARPAYRRLSTDGSPSPGLSGPSAPLLIEAGSFDQSPHLLDVYSNWTESTVEKQPRGSDDVEEDRIKETLADAMVESPMRDMEKLVLRQDLSRTNIRKVTTEAGGKNSIGKKEESLQRRRAVKTEKNTEIKVERLEKERSKAEKQEKGRRVVDAVDCKKTINNIKGRTDVLDKNMSETKSGTKTKSDNQFVEEKHVSFSKVEATRVNVVPSEKDTKKKAENPDDLKTSERKSPPEPLETDVKGKSNSKNSKKKNKSKGEQKPNTSTNSSDSLVKETATRQQPVDVNKTSEKNPAKQVRVDKNYENWKQDEVKLKPKEANKSKNTDAPIEDLMEADKFKSKASDAPVEDLMEADKSQSKNTDVPVEDLMEADKSASKASDAPVQDLMEADKSKSKASDAPVEDLNSAKCSPREEGIFEKQDKLLEKSKCTVRPENFKSQKEDVKCAKPNKTCVSKIQQQNEQPPIQSANRFNKSLPKVKKDEELSQQPETSLSVHKKSLPDTTDVLDSPTESIGDPSPSESVFKDTTEVDIVNGVPMQNQAGAENKRNCDPNESYTCDIKSVNINFETVESSSKGISDVRTEIELNKDAVTNKSTKVSDSQNNVEVQKNKTKKQKKGKDKQKAHTMTESKIIGSNKEDEPKVSEVVKEDKSKDKESTVYSANDVKEDETIETLDPKPDNTYEGNSNPGELVQPGVDIDEANANLIKEDIEDSVWYTPDIKKKKNRRKAQEKETVKVEESSNENGKGARIKKKERSASPMESTEVICPEKNVEENNDITIEGKIPDTTAVEMQEFETVISTKNENITQLIQTDKRNDNDDNLDDVTVDEIKKTTEDVSDITQKIGKNTAIEKAKNNTTDTKGKKKQKKKKEGFESDLFEVKTESDGRTHSLCTKKDFPTEPEGSQIPETETAVTENEIIAKKKDSEIHVPEIINVTNTDPVVDRSHDDMKQVDTNDKLVLSFEVGIQRIDSLERSPSYESVRSTLSEERQLSKADGTDSEVLASTEQSDSDMVEVKSKKKKKKKKVGLEESMYYEAAEPEQTMETKATNKIDITPAEITTEIKDKLNNFADSKLSEIVKDTKDTFDLPDGVSPTINPSEENIKFDTEMFIVKSKKNKKNKKSQSKQPDSKESQSSGSVETVFKDETDRIDIDSDITTEKPSIIEAETDITPINSDMTVESQAENTDLNRDGDPTAWETAAKVNSDESQTDVMTNDASKIIQDKTNVNWIDTQVKGDKVSIETPETSTSSCRSSEERDDQKVEKTKESKGEPKTKKKRKKNRR